MKAFFAALWLYVAISSSPLWAEPVAYDLDRAASRVDFIYRFGEDEVTGRFADFSMDLVLDFDDVTRSSVVAVLQTETVQGGFIFATQALRGPQILDVARFPVIEFRSGDVHVQGDDIVVDGQITLRGITRPQRMIVRLFRAAGSDISARDNLTLTMTGQLDRHDFGASGYGDLVGPILKIEITASINRRP